MDIDVGGRCAVITGASRGLGAGLARDFAARGMQLGLCSRSDPALPAGDFVVAANVDVRDEQAVEAFTRRVEERFGAIDLWINNAGVLEPIAFVRDTPVEAFREHVDINLAGVFIGTAAYLRHLDRVGSRGGVLMNVSSGAARKGYAGWGAYCSAKSAVDRLTECVAIEEAERGLRAYSVAPGVIDTEMQEQIRACTPDRFPEVERFVEMKRDDVYNTPRFVAAELISLAFDAARRDEEVCLYLPNEKG